MEKVFENAKHSLERATSRKELVSGLEKCLLVFQEIKKSTFGTDSTECLEGGYKLSALLDTIIACLTPSLVGFLSGKEQMALIGQSFLEAPPLPALLCLSGVFASGTQADGYKLEKTLWLLNLFIRERLEELIRPLISPPTDNNELKRLELYKTLSQELVSLPERVENVCHGKKSTFSSDDYTRFVAIALSKVLSGAHDQIRSERNADLRIFSHILARFQLSGYGDNLLKILIPWLSKQTIPNVDSKDSNGETQFVWSRISERVLVRGLPPRAVEGVVTTVVLIADLRCIPYLLGDSVTTDATVKKILTSKMIFSKIFPRDLRIPLKIATYLHVGGPERKKILEETFLHLLKLWADKGSIAHSSLEQRRYISQCLLAFLTQVSQNEQNIQKIKPTVTDLMLSGMTAHLDSVMPGIRLHGMVVGEKLACVFEPDGGRLDFGVASEDPELKLLSDLSGDNDDVETLVGTFEICDLDSQSSATEVTGIQFENVNVLDSDDDLEPYDLPPEELNLQANTSSNNGEPPEKKAKSPIYIRDCMDGLNEMKDYARFEASLFNMETLIRKRAVGLNEIAGKLSLRLLTLEDRFSSADFETVRQNALVACCVIEPRTVVRCLLAEFYAKNYTVRQRLLVLEVITSAAKELSSNSSATQKENTIEIQPDTVKQIQNMSTDIPAWRQEVDARVQAKTRRITSGKSSSKSSEITANRFASLAAEFFYPLLNLYDPQQATCLDLIGRDYFVLGRILYTLGTVVYCSQNCAVVPGMVRALFPVVWDLRFHKEKYVHHALLFIISMIAMVLPARVAATAFAEDLQESLNWLMDLTSQEEGDTQKMATSAIILIQTKLQDGKNDVINIAL